MKPLLPQTITLNMDPRQILVDTAKAIHHLSQRTETGFFSQEPLGELSPEEEGALMAAWTGREHIGSQIDQKIEPLPDLNDAWPVLRNAISRPESGMPMGEPDLALVLGASGDIMLNHARRIESSPFYRPKCLWYLAGMRPLGTNGDRSFFRHLGLSFDSIPHCTETHLAQMVIERIHGGVVTETKFIPSTVVESVNALGPRTWSHRFFRTADGRTIVLLNGASVARRGGGEPRHTAESAFQEFTDTAQLSPKSKLDIIATYPHAERVGMELGLALLKKAIPVQIGVVSVLPPADRLSPEGLLAALMPLYRVAKEYGRAEIRYGRLPLLRVAGNGDSGAVRSALFSATRLRLIDALLGVAPPKSAIPLNDIDISLESYLIDGVEDSLFSHDDTRKACTDLLIQLGIDDRETIGPDLLDIKKPYLFYIDNLNAENSSAYGDMLTKTKNPPAAIMIRGSRPRFLAFPGLIARPPEVPFRTKIIPSEKALELEIEAGGVELLGYAERDIPVFVLDVQGASSLGGSLDSTPAIAEERYLLCADILNNPAFSAFFAKTTKGYVICIGESTLHAPSRTIALLNARERLLKRGSVTQMGLALYGINQDQGLARQRHLTSELRLVLQAILEWESTSGA